jgi:lipoprotein-anchoring transpeptidase ErfK/SrfK
MGVFPMLRKNAGPIVGLIVLFTIAGCGSPIMPGRAKPLVNVYNGCNSYCTKLGVGGLAREINKKLIEAEYIVGEPKNLSNYKVITEIVYNPADERAAKDIQETLEVGKLIPQQEIPPGGVQVILGMDSVVGAFPTMKIDNKILILNSTRKKGLAKEMTIRINHDLTKKIEFYTSDNADRYYYETVTYYPPSLEASAKEIFGAVGKGRMEPVEMLKDIVVVMGLEFDPNTQKRLGIAEETAIPAAKVVVDKTDFTLFVYDLSGNLLASFPVSIGKNPDLGDKKQAGDDRTPEGSFTVSGIEDSSSWTFEGRPAYGPWFISLSTPPFSGIGIHGTDEPEKIGTTASEGCIRMRNEDLERLMSYVKVGTIVDVRH